MISHEGFTSFECLQAGRLRLAPCGDVAAGGKAGPAEHGLCRRTTKHSRRPTYRSLLNAKLLRERYISCSCCSSDLHE